MLDWISSEMHFELMEANSCLTVLQSDMVVGKNGLGRNVKHQAASLCQLLGERLYFYRSVY